MWKFHCLSLSAAALSAALFPVLAEARPAGGGGHQVRGGGRASVQGPRPAPRPAPAHPPNVNANRGGAYAGNHPGNRPGNINHGGDANRYGNRVNTGHVNVGNNVNVNVDHDNGWGWGWDDHDHHPVAAGVAFGTAAAVTSAAIGSRYYALPPACSPYPYSGYTYYSCGGVYYAPQYEGDTVVYVVVDRPR